jgi:tRNA dimethylallyltransferase
MNEAAGALSIARDCWFLTGPTASGKTALGIELAQRLGGEILSLDSMAVYRQLDIGTAKPTAAERRAAPHHLIDLVEPEVDFSLAEYLAAAKVVASEVIARGAKPIFVGGTPLYLKGLLRGVFAGPAADWEFRRGCREEFEREGGPARLHARLAEVDPPAAARLHPRDSRRIIRALEVWENTGRPISDWQRQFDRPVPTADCRVFVLDWPRETLQQRIESRVDAMFAAGLVDEIRGLFAEGRSLSRTARQALGYREVLSHLSGETDLAATIELVKIRTRQFAKRQMTWFRSLSECRWLPLEEGRSPAYLAETIAAS